MGIRTAAGRGLDALRRGAAFASESARGVPAGARNLASRTLLPATKFALTPAALGWGAGVGLNITPEQARAHAPLPSWAGHEPDSTFATGLSRGVTGLAEAGNFFLHGYPDRVGQGLAGAIDANLARDTGFFEGESINQRLGSAAQNARGLYEGYMGGFNNDETRLEQTLRANPSPEAVQESLAMQARREAMGKSLEADPDLRDPELRAEYVALVESDPTLSSEGRELALNHARRGERLAKEFDEEVRRGLDAIRDNPRLESQIGPDRTPFGLAEEEGVSPADEAQLDTVVEEEGRGLDSGLASFLDMDGRLQRSPEEAIVPESSAEPAAESPQLVPEEGAAARTLTPEEINSLAPAEQTIVRSAQREQQTPPTRAQMTARDAVDNARREIMMGNTDRAEQWKGMAQLISDLDNNEHARTVEILGAANLGGNLDPDFVASMDDTLNALSSIEGHGMSARALALTALSHATTGELASVQDAPLDPTDDNALNRRYQARLQPVIHSSMRAGLTLEGNRHVDFRDHPVLSEKGELNMGAIEADFNATFSTNPQLAQAFGLNPDVRQNTPMQTMVAMQVYKAARAFDRPGQSGGWFSSDRPERNTVGMLSGDALSQVFPPTFALPDPANPREQITMGELSEIAERTGETDVLQIYRDLVADALGR